MLIDWLQRHPRLIDRALVVIALAAVGTTHHGLSAASVPLAAAAALSLLWRRRWPLGVLVLTTLATAITVAAWDAYDVFPAGVALYTVAERCRRRTALVAGGATLAALLLPLWASVGWAHPIFMLGRFFPFAVAWLIGDSVGTRRRYVAALEERAERLEREREVEAARAVAEEQARIARELHDVIAHNLSVMVVQAAAAGDVFERRPERAREALGDIERTGRGALDELRRLIGGVRGAPAAYAPQPGLDVLEPLLAQVRGAGLEVALRVEGEPRPLPAGVDLSAYRVVQEALTNTLKHAHARRAEIALRYGESELGVEVCDDGAGPAAGDGHGHGLIGMRERVGLYGGSLETGAAPGGGFAVCARFPLDGVPT